MMTAIRNLIVRLRNDERGLTAVEYAVLGGIVVGALATVGVQFGTAIEEAFNTMIGQM